MGVRHLRNPELVKLAQRAGDVTLAGGALWPIILCPFASFLIRDGTEPFTEPQPRVPMDTHPSKPESGFSCDGVNPGQPHQLRSRLQFC